MPSETVYDQAGMYDVILQWHPGASGWVQVGITTHDGRSIATHLSEGEETGNDRTIDPPAPGDGEPPTVTLTSPAASLATPANVGTHFTSAAGHPDSALAGHARAHYTINQPAAGTSYASFPTLWGTLDREGINALIRKLRRARRDVYGEDA